MCAINVTAVRARVPFYPIDSNIHSEDIMDSSVSTHAEPGNDIGLEEQLSDDDDILRPLTPPPTQPDTRTGSVSSPPLNHKADPCKSSPDHRGKNGEWTEICMGTTGPTISFKNVTTVVSVKGARCKTVEKEILTQISGVFKPGLNVIMGPTGAGKTTLLDILSVRKDPVGVSGQVLIDGKPIPSQFRLMSGYVVQENVLMCNLTVRENLMFSANLRLPRTMSNEQKTTRVNEVIQELGLQNCADTLIGNELIRGVSGGERKRSNIGMELITRPSVLYLDEPTSGLDACTALSVIKILKRLSLEGRTIITSIHQPRFQIYRLFDNLMLLSRGHCVYHGPVDSALDYFSKYGFVCDEHDNPADFFLDLMYQYEENGINIGEDVRTEVSTKYSDGVLPLMETGTELFDLYDRSELSADNKTTVTQYHSDTDNINTSVLPGTTHINYATSFLSQIGYVLSRNTTTTWRNKRLSIYQLVYYAVFALIIGGLFFDMDLSFKSGIQNRAGVIYFIALQTLFSNMSAVEAFLSERAIFIHETASGYYRVSSYFISKVTVDLLMIRGPSQIIYCLIVYWMMGLKAEFGAFLIFTLIVWATMCGSSCLAFLMSTTINNRGLAILLTSTCYVLMALFAGLLLNVKTLPVFVNYLQYLSLARYIFNGLSVNEFRGLQFCGDINNGTSGGGDLYVCMSGEEFLADQGIPYTDTDLGFYISAIFIMIAVLLTLAYAQLRRMPKTK